jgi:hypothetical protein
MLKIRLLTVILTFAIMLPAYAEKLPIKKMDSLADLPGSSWISDCYAKYPYFFYATAGVAAFAFLYAFNEGFRDKVKSAFGVRVQKDCACGCLAECGCRTGADSVCSMTSNKSNQACGCCAVRPAQIQ